MSDAALYYFVLETPRNYNFDVQKFRSQVMCRHAAEGFKILANTRQCFSAFTSKVFFLLQWIMMKALRPFKCSS